MTNVMSTIYIVKRLPGDLGILDCNSKHREILVQILVLLPQTSNQAKNQNLKIELFITTRFEKHFLNMPMIFRRYLSVSWIPFWNYTMQRFVNSCVFRIKQNASVVLQTSISSPTSVIFILLVVFLMHVSCKRTMFWNISRSIR